MIIEGKAGEGIDEVLDEAANKDLRSVFTPDTACLAHAVIKFMMIHLRLKMLMMTTEDEDYDIHTALNVILVHLEYAYPDFRRKLVKR
jgi:hypothetical protein